MCSKFNQVAHIENAPDTTTLLKCSPLFQTKCAVISILFLFFRTGDSSVPTSTPQEGGGKTNAKEVRACGHVPSVKSPALSVRGFHESVQVSFSFITVDEFIINLIYVFPIEQGKPCKLVTC